MMPRSGPWGACCRWVGGRLLVGGWVGGICGEAGGRCNGWACVGLLLPSASAEPQLILPELPHCRA